MRRSLLGITKLCALSILFIGLLTGCSSDAEPNSTGTNPNSTGTNPNSTGTNPNSTGPNPNSNDSSSSSQNENFSSSDLEKNITSSGAITELGKLVVFVKNNNKVAVDMEIEAEFYDSNGTIVGSDSEDLKAVGSNGEIAVEMWSTPKTFDNYKIYVDVEQSDEISYYNQVEAIHNNNGKEIAVQIKNNSQDVIEYITVSVVYYQGDKVVGIDDSIESDIKSGRSANFNLDFPYNNRYKNVKFDNYKVFVNEAYSYNW